MKDVQARLNVAILAEAFNPNWPSLPIVAFKYAFAISKFANVTVFTQIRNRENISKVANIDFEIEYIDTEFIVKPFMEFANWLRGGQDLGWTIAVAAGYIPYIEFERRALKLINQHSVPFDVVHRITPMTPTLPSYVAGRCKAPFILGPLNGNLPWPKEFMEEQRREREFLSRIKQIYKYMPFHGSTMRKSAAILAAFPHTVQEIDPELRNKTIDMPEIGYDEDIFYSSERLRSERLTFLYAGRLVPYKLPEIAILAFKQRPELQRHVLKIAGTGPDEGRLRSIVEESQLQGCVEFLGGLTQSQVADEMRRADVFFFPSIRELGAGVVVEALACGLPCLVADYGAPGALVDSDRGRKITIDRKEPMIAQFAAAAAELAASPTLLDEMSRAAQAYAQKFFTWENKARATVEIYNWVLDPKQPKPGFPY